MFRPRNTLLEAALAYATTGIAVRSAYTLVRAPARYDAFGRWICSCGDLLCDAPGEHLAAESGWTTDIHQVAATWSETPPNLLITSGERVSFWRVPRVSGAEGLRLFEQLRPGPWPAHLKLPSGEWLVATLPPAGDIELPTGVVHLESGVPVLAPPSRRPPTKDGLLGLSTRTRWLQASGFPRTPLPTAEDVLRLVGRAELERIELLSGVRTLGVV